MARKDKHQPELQLLIQAPLQPESIGSPPFQLPLPADSRGPEPLPEYQQFNQGGPTLPQQSQPKKRFCSGFSDKTVWDLLTVFLVPLMIGIGTIGVAMQQNRLSQSQFSSDQSIALDQQREATLKTYMDDMTDLLINRGLQTSKTDAEVRVVARAKTLVALRKLDGDRKGLLIQFLCDANLTGNGPGDAIISLQNTDLSGIHLEQANLLKADLSGANLSGADLRKANLENANLFGANLSGADLSNANLINTNLIYANLSGANLMSAKLVNAYLNQADLTNTNLRGITVWISGLSKGGTTGTVAEQLSRAYTLKGATLPDGSAYPSQSYAIPNHKEPGS
ncbi:MAG TPA: pentapeptide repeat-containing protein [Ktedonosporobacter sp.]|nr:pentapeptide repeat-containing protein [Ktedonosporobacter sp.]